MWGILSVKNKKKAIDNDVDNTAFYCVKNDINMDKFLGYLHFLRDVYPAFVCILAE